MTNRFSIIIHGPLESETLYENLEALVKCNFIDDIIISIYADSVPEVNNILRTMNLPDNISVVSNNDVFNPGFYNINRHINLVSKALEHVENGKYVFKLRMDQKVDFSKVYDIWFGNKSHILDKILTTNCYTRRDRLYHPSDMFMGGLKENLQDYFPKGGFSSTHMDDVLAIREGVRNGNLDFSDHWPESRLFKEYIKRKGEDINFPSFEHSLEMLSKYTFVVNSWDIDFRWSKFRKAKSIVLPYHFSMAPFPGGPKEPARNFAGHEVNKSRPTVKDEIFRLYSYMYFVFYNTIMGYKTMKRIKVDSLKKLYMLSFSFIPPVAHKYYHLLGKKIYNALR